MRMSSNVNTREYWEARFASGDWESRGGTTQTQQFALSIVRRLKITRAFKGTLLDFGCGLGDAIPVYRSWFPDADLVGVDISAAAIEECKRRYGHMAEFIAGDHTVIPKVDCIVSSNVFEHLSGDKHIAGELLKKCQDLYIATPYMEELQKQGASGEHVNTYDRQSFSNVAPCTSEVYLCRAWSDNRSGYNLWVNVYLKNLIRPLLGKPRHRRPKQILFHLKNVASGKF